MESYHPIGNTHIVPVGDMLFHLKRVRWTAFFVMRYVCRIICCFVWDTHIMILAPYYIVSRCWIASCYIFRLVHVYRLFNNLQVRTFKRCI